MSPEPVTSLPIAPTAPLRLVRVHPDWKSALLATSEALEVGATTTAPQQQRCDNSATTTAPQQRRHNNGATTAAAAHPSPQVRDLRRDGRRRPEPAISAANSPNAEPSEAAQAPSASAPAPAASSTCHGGVSSTCHGRLLGLKWRRENVQASAATTMRRRIAAAAAGATAKDGRPRE